MNDVAIICTCKGRLATLKHTLPKMCSQITDFNYQVVLVDYGCPDDAFQYFKDNPLKNLTLIKVLDGTKFFNLSRARNIGAVLSDSNIITFLDADCIVQPEWLSLSVSPIIRGDTRITRPGTWYNACDIMMRTPEVLGRGVMSIRRKTFLVERGYDEQMQGWGYEDDDMCKRLSTHHNTDETGGFPHIALMSHAKDSRTTFYKEKNPMDSWRANRHYANRRIGIINEAGIGVCQYEITRDM